VCLLVRFTPYLKSLTASYQKRAPYEYIVTLDKYTLQFVREGKGQEVVPGDKYFPKKYACFMFLTELKISLCFGFLFSYFIAFFCVDVLF
jgi:hypothetical protein